MNDEKSDNVDLLGIKPIANSINTVVETASEFLNIICRPAAEEFGLLLQDSIRYWRIKNLSNIAIKTKTILNVQDNNIDLSASPRIVNNILENGSWIDDNRIQEMWAGLLASACTKEGKDESNLIFINLLSQLTYSEVNIMNYCCENAEKCITQHGLIFAKDFIINLEILRDISGIIDIHQIDRELDHLRSLELLSPYSGFDINQKFDEKPPQNIEISTTPSGLALNMYVRCNGSLKTTIEYFNVLDNITEHQS